VAPAAYRAQRPAMPARTVPAELDARAAVIWHE
jgi:hypothetical protein